MDKIYKSLFERVFMKYDIYVINEDLAESIVGFIDRAYLVDTSTYPDVYQFFDLKESELKGVRGLVEDFPSAFEIRGSEGGDMIWPSPGGVSLDQALDLI